MSRGLVAALVVAAVLVGVYCYRWVPTKPIPMAVPAKEPAIHVEEVLPPASSSPPATHGTAASRPKAVDPRMAALMVSPQNALIEFFTDPAGRVIKEIDNDPASASFGRPLREYTYAGDKVIRLVKYQYTGDETQTVTADIIYKPDGSIDQYKESTGYTYANKN
jgi:hypothetical protein